MDEPLFTVGLDEPEAPANPPGRGFRWSAFVVGVAAVATAFVFAGLTDADDPTPETVPLPPPPSTAPSATPSATPGWTWTTLGIPWGNVIVDAGPGLLVGTGTWRADGGTWRYVDTASLVGTAGPTDLGSLPTQPVATATDHLTVGGLIDGALVVERIALDGGTRDTFTPVPWVVTVGPDAVIERDGEVFVDTGDRVWWGRPGTTWQVDDRIAAVTIAEDAPLGLGTGADSLVAFELREQRWVAVQDVPLSRAPGTVSTSSGPGWSFAQACLGSVCDVIARPTGAGWQLARELDSLPRWNGSEWWTAGVWASAGADPVAVSGDGLSWETVPTPGFMLASDEQVLVHVLPGPTVVLSVLRPDGTSEVWVGRRA